MQEKDEVLNKQFDYFCKKILKNEANSILRETNRLNEKEITFSYIGEDALNELMVYDTYEVFTTQFSAIGFIIHIEDERIAFVLLELDYKKRTVDYQYFLKQVLFGHLRFIFSKCHVV